MSVITQRILEEITNRAGQARNYVRQHGGLIGGAAAAGAVLAGNPEIVEQAVQLGRQGYSYGRKIFQVNNMLDQTDGSMQPVQTR